MGIHGVVLGASGYSASELLRCLCAHPAFEVVAVAGGSSAGTGLKGLQPHLPGADLGTLVTTDEALETPSEVVFSCLPGDVQLAWPDDAVVVDLSDAHRASPDWVYGLTEYCRSALPAPRIANPGCYPTAALLACVPFAKAGAISGPVIIDALSGFSGAGRSAKREFLLADGYGDAGAYGTTTHRHVSEIEAQLEALTGVGLSVSFTPHLVPMSRGLLVTVRAPLRSAITDAEAVTILKEQYAGESFVRVQEAWPHTKAVAGSNSAVLSARVDDRTGFLIVSAAIDNLGKGAAGQAIQNANLAFGLDETLGLQTAGVWP